jgi:hypothetical protein
MMAEFFQLTGGLGGSLERVISTDRPEPCAERSPFGSLGPRPRIDLARGGQARDLSPSELEQVKRDDFHEQGHHVEFDDPVLTAAAHSLRLSRASGPPQPASYGFSYPGDTYDAYVLRAYPWERTTEVTSRGLEKFAAPETMLELARRDREHFHFVLGAIRLRIAGAGRS